MVGFLKKGKKDRCCKSFICKVFGYLVHLLDKTQISIGIMIRLIIHKDTIYGREVSVNILYVV